MDFSSPTVLAYISSSMAGFAALTTVAGNLWTARQNRKAEDRRRIADREAEEKRWMHERNLEEQRNIRDREAEELRRQYDREAQALKDQALRDSEDNKQVRELASQLALEAWRRKVEIFKDKSSEDHRFRGSKYEPNLEQILNQYHEFFTNLSKRNPN
jgi:hypothetical protein